MRWEDRLCALFEDLEQQAEGLHLSERDAEVGERSRAEYAGVTLASRLHASVGLCLTLRLSGPGRLVGVLLRVGVGWCMVRADSSGQVWIVPSAAVLDVQGLSARAVSEPARSVLARLGLGSALRGVAEAGANVVFEQVDGSQHRGAVVRVGSDFVEIRDETGPATVRRSAQRAEHVIPFAALAAVREA